MGNQTIKKKRPTSHAMEIWPSK